MELLRRVERHTVRPVYVLFGPEHRLRDALIDAICRVVVEPGWEEMNVAKFTGDLPECYQLCHTPTFGGGRRVVLCVDSQLLGGGRKDTASSRAQDLLLRYLPQPSPHSCLVITCPVDRADQRLRVFRILEEAGALVECGVPSTTEAMAWATQYAADRGRRLAKEAAAHIVEGCLRRLGDIERELDKLMLYAGDAKQLTMADARAAGAARGAQVFELTDAVTAGKEAAALSVLQQLFRQGEAPVMIVFMLARQLRLLWQAARLSAQGQRPVAVAQALRVPVFVASRLVEGAAAMGPAQLPQAFRILLEADVAIKSGQLHEHQAVELATLKLCRLRVQRQ